MFCQGDLRLFRNHSQVVDVLYQLSKSFHLDRTEARTEILLLQGQVEKLRNVEAHAESLNKIIQAMKVQKYSLFFFNRSSQVKYEPQTAAPISQQETDEYEYVKQPSGAYWVDKPSIDILLMFGILTGQQSGLLLKETVKKTYQTLDIQHLEFPNVTRENFVFSPEKVEETIAK